MFCANSFNELAWWDKYNGKCPYLPGAFDKRGYELADNCESMAKDPEIPVKDLMALTKDKNKYIRGNVVRNPNTPVEVLKMLTNDKNEHIRLIVADNPNTPVETLKMLENDEDRSVKSVATNRLDGYHF